MVSCAPSPNIEPLTVPLPPPPTSNLNCTDNYDVAKIRMKSVTDHQ